VRTLHFSNAAIRDYFYTTRWPGGTLYDVVGVRPSASRTELSMGYRIRRIEASDEGAGACCVLERAYNLLGYPDLRSCYDQILKDRNAPALFPYNACGACVVSGRLNSEGDRLFVHEILAYAPDLKELRFRAALRRVEFVSDFAVYRDPQRKVTVYMDSALFPSAGDPTWSRWRHLVGSRIGVTAMAVRSQADTRSGGDRKRGVVHGAPRTVEDRGSRRSCSRGSRFKATLDANRRAS
jgi:hypothetical protein